jgi:glycosyltransferase involved in cell wall biosynthesis
VSDDGVDYRAHAGACADDRRVRFVSSGGIGTGPAAARNAGLALARGGHVCALDADDRFAPQRLGVLLSAAACCGVAADCVNVVDTQGRTLRHAFPPGSGDRDIDAGEIMDCGVPLHPLVRRDLLGAGWPDLRFAEDVMLNLQLLDRAGGFVMVMRPLYDYVVHPASICHRPDAAEVADAAYGRILDGLRDGAFGLSQAAGRVALEGFAAKRATNRAFAEAQDAGLVSSFQEFLALASART